MEISWNFVSPKKWEPWTLTYTDWNLDKNSLEQNTIVVI